MKITGVQWFTDTGDAFGIVYGYDEHTKKPKAYIGHATGIDAEKDKCYIRDYGAKFLPEHAKELNDFLNPVIKE